MPSFSTASKRQLATCDPRLQEILNEVIKDFDFSVLEGFRDEEDQNADYAKGLSQKRWPDSKHNSRPSLAVDVAPYPIDWGDSLVSIKAEAARQRFCYLAGWIMSVAEHLSVRLRWGGDWDGDRDTRDERFRDLGHFELLEDGK